MEFFGCNCSVRRKISLASVRGMYAASRLNRGGLSCPFCRNQLIHRMYSMGLGDNSIDVSCIDIVPLLEDIRFHQDDAANIPEIYGRANADKQELVDGFAELAEVKGPGFSHSIFRNLSRISDEHLFFPARQQDISDIDADSDWL